jgi:SAM-dependent methyltransferase
MSFVPKKKITFPPLELRKRAMKPTANGKHYPAVPQNQRKVLANNNLFTDLSIEVGLNCYKIQVDALWSDESPLLLNAYRACFMSYQLRGSKDPIRILDVGCGTGEVLTRLIGPNGLFEHLGRCKGQVLEIHGVELDQPMYEFCKQRLDRLKHSTNVSISIHNACATKLPFESQTFDLVLNRHMLHSIPKKIIPNVLDETYRVLKPNGTVHFVAEDIEMIYTSTDDDKILNEQKQLWSEGMCQTGADLGVDLRIGRRLPSLLTQHGFVVQFVKFASVDTCKMDRQSLVLMFETWRNGYSNAWNKNQVNFKYDVYFENFIELVKDKSQYVCWNVPIIQAVKKIQPNMICTDSFNRLTD